MTLLALSHIEQINKKHYLLQLNDGQVMQLSINGMFSIHILQAQQEVAQVSLQPLSSMNNLEMPPLYRVTHYQAPTGDLSVLASALLDAMLSVYAWYTNGSIKSSPLSSMAAMMTV